MPFTEFGDKLDGVSKIVKGNVVDGYYNTVAWCGICKL